MFIWYDLIRREKIGHTSIGSIAPANFGVTQGLAEAGIFLPGGKIVMGGANQVVTLAEFAAIVEMIGYQGNAAVIDFVTGHNGRLAEELGVDFVCSNIIRSNSLPEASASIWVHDNLLTTLMNPEPQIIMSGYEHTAVIGSVEHWLSPGGIMVVRESANMRWADLMEVSRFSVVEIPWVSFANRRQQTRYFSGYDGIETIEYDTKVIVARKPDGTDADDVFVEAVAAANL